jgi:hypothetical protein
MDQVEVLPEARNRTPPFLAELQLFLQSPRQSRVNDKNRSDQGDYGADGLAYSCSMRPTAFLMAGAGLLGAAPFGLAQSAPHVEISLPSGRLSWSALLRSEISGPIQSVLEFGHMEQPGRLDFRRRQYRRIRPSRPGSRAGALHSLPHGQVTRRVNGMTSIHPDSFEAAH